MGVEKVLLACLITKATDTHTHTHTHVYIYIYIYIIRLLFHCNNGYANASEHCVIVRCLTCLGGVMNVLLHLHVQFHLALSQPRINRTSPHRTVTCKLPCYFPRFQIGKNRVASSDIAGWEDARMALKSAIGKIIVRMASGNIWGSWLLGCVGICLVGPWWVGVLFVCSRKSMRYVMTFGFRRSMHFCWKLLSVQGRSVQWIRFHLHLMLLMVIVKWAIYSGWCMVESILRDAHMSISRHV